MPKDPDIKSSSKSVKTTKAKTAKKPAKATSSAKAKTLTFKDKLNKFGIKREHNKKTIVTVGVGALVALFLTIAIFGVTIYKYKSSNRAVKIASKIIPYPVASVNGNWFWNTVSYDQYLTELASYTKYAQSQDLDLTSETGKKTLAQIKDTIIKQQEDILLVKQGASKFGIKVTDKELNDKYNQLIKENGGVEKVKAVLQQYQGISLSAFKSRLKLQMLADKLGNKITSDDSLNAPAKKQAEEILKQIQAGGDFAELAKKYSTDASASNGGDLGLISKGQTVPEFEAAAFALQDGQVSSVVKTQYGYHIIKVTGREGDQVRVSHILIKGVDLDSWIKDQRAKAKIVQYFKP